METSDSRANGAVSNSIQHDDARETTPLSAGSDAEGGERSARERLKKASIGGLHQAAKDSDGGAIGDQPIGDAITTDPILSHQVENEGLRGRPSKKRSFEDLQESEQACIEIDAVSAPDPKRNSHKRMRSRDVQQGDQEYRKLEDMGSPVHEEEDDDAKLSPGGAGVLVGVPSRAELDREADKQAEARILEEEDTTNEPTVGVGSAADTLPSTSLQAPKQPTKDHVAPTLQPSPGFANASSTSPFGAVASPPQSTIASPSSKAEPATTSNSAFASSGMSAFASLEKSPFGATATATSTGGFGGKASGFGGLAAPSKGFGATSSGFGGASPFAPKSSGFGGSSGGFGASSGGFGGGVAPKPFSGGLTSFAGPSSGSSTFGGKVKPFGPKDGSKDEEEAEGSDAGDEDEKQDQSESEQPDSRFHEQHVETGEEEEETVFQARAKLFHYEDRAWKERGVGVFKINVRYESTSMGESEESKDEEQQGLENGHFSSTERRGRMIMRTDGVHKVIFNSPIFKEMNIGSQDGSEPNGRTMLLTGLEDGKPRGFQIRIGKEEVLKELYHKVQELKDEL